MKVLYLIEEIGRGGKERRLTELIKGLVASDPGIQIHLALSNTNIKYIEINSFPITIHFLNSKSTIGLVLSYYRLFKELSPDIVHTWSFKTSFFASLLKPFFKYKFISGFIGDTFTPSIKNKFLSKVLVFRKSDIIVSNSLKGLSTYRVPVHKGRTIYNGFDPMRISSNESNPLKELGITTANVVVMLANVSQYKDYKLFLKLSNDIIGYRDDVTFISIGKIHPEYKNLTEEYIENKHSKIKFLGLRADVAELIKNCNIGLLCTYREGISNAIIELMANGIPVITNDLNGGTQEVIQNDEDGIICESELLEEKLNFLLDDTSARLEMGNKAKKKVFENFTLSAMISEYSKIYRLN